MLVLLYTSALLLILSSSSPTPLSSSNYNFLNAIEEPNKRGPWTSLPKNWERNSPGSVYAPYQGFEDDDDLTNKWVILEDNVFDHDNPNVQLDVERMARYTGHNEGEPSHFCKVYQRIIAKYLEDTMIFMHVEECTGGEYMTNNGMLQCVQHHTTVVIDSKDYKFPTGCIVKRKFSFN